MKIVKFVQPGCVPCKMVDGLLKHLNLQVDQTIDIAVDENGMQLAEVMGVKSTPTLILLSDENIVVDRVSGMNQDGIKAIFDKRA